MAHQSSAIHLFGASDGSTLTFKQDSGTWQLETLDTNGGKLPFFVDNELQVEGGGVTWDVGLGLSGNAADIATEVTTARAAEAANAASLVAEAATARAAEAANASAIATENARAVAAEGVLAGDLATETAERITADTAIQAAVAAEATTRAAADAIHTANIAGVAADVSTNATAIAVETARATAAENANAALVTAEVAARTAAVAGVQSQITDLLSNVDPAALDSLAEIVAQFSSNGVLFHDRLLWVEGMVSTLHNVAVPDQTAPGP